MRSKTIFFFFLSVASTVCGEGTVATTAEATTAGGGGGGGEGTAATTTPTPHCNLFNIAKGVFNINPESIQLKGIANNGDLQLVANYTAPTKCTADKKVKFGVDLMDKDCNHRISKVPLNANFNSCGVHRCKTTLDLNVKVAAVQLISGATVYKFCLRAYFDNKLGQSDIQVKSDQSMTIVKSTENTFELQTNVTNVDANVNTNLKSSDKIEVMFCEKDTDGKWKEDNTPSTINSAKPDLLKICIHPNKDDKSYECKAVDKLAQRRKKSTDADYGPETVRWLGDGGTKTGTIECAQTGSVTFGADGTPALSGTNIKNAQGQLPNGCYCRLMISPDYLRTFDSVQLSGGVTIGIAKGRRQLRTITDNIDKILKRRLQEEYFSVGMTVKNDENIDENIDSAVTITLPKVLAIVIASFYWSF